MSPASSDQDRSDFVSVAEAARILGTSTATIKRRIRAGTLEAEPVTRPQGHQYLVKVPRDVTPALSERFDSEQHAPFTSAHATSQDHSAAITAATAPLLERLTVADTLFVALTADLRAVERENGRLSAELATAQAALTERDAERCELRATMTALMAENDALRAMQATLDVSAATPASGPSPEPSAYWWRPWAVYGVMALVAVMLAVVLLTVPW